MALNVFGTPSNMTYSGSGASGDPYVIESTNHSVNTTSEIIFQTTESGTIFPNLSVDSEIASDVAGLFRNTIPIWQASGQDNFSTSFRVLANDQVKVNYIKDGAGAFGDDNVTGSVYFVPDPPEPLPEVAIVMVTQPVSSLSGSVLATQPSVKIVDVNGDIVPGTLISVTVGAVVVSGAAVASGTLTVEPVSGNVVFTDLVITGYGSYYLSFTAAGLTPASSNTITFVQDPGNPNPPIPVKPKRSYIPASVPNSGDMETNEFAINVTDKKGYVKDSNGIIHQVFDGNASGTGSVTSVGLSSTNSTLTISDSPVTTSGTIKIDLPETGVSAKAYTNADITIDVYGRITAASDGAAGVTSIIAGTGVSVDTATGDVTVTNSLPDQTVTLTDGTGISVTGTYPDFTITNDAPDQTVTLTDGTGISVTGTYPDFTIATTITQYTDSDARLSLSSGTGISYDNTTGIITNDAPDQTVSITSGTGINVTGTYPDFTIDSTITQYTDSDARLSLSAGTGISYDNATGIITNSEPDQIVSLTGGTDISVTGTYPDFTIDFDGNTSYLPLSGGTMTGSITSFGTTHDTEVSGDFFGVQLSADHTQGTMVNFDGLDTYDGASHMKVTPTGLTFPDATIQTTAYTGGAGVSSITAGTGINVDVTTGDVTVTNSSPDQTVSLTNGAGISVTGTYPSFTIATTITQYTDTDARKSISSTATGLTYTNTTGVFSLTSGYAIPTTTKQTNWDTAYTNRIISLTTIGSGAATLIANVLNIPNPQITSLTVTGNSGASTLSSGVLNVPTYTLAGLGGQASSTNLSSLSNLTYASSSFVKMTAAGTFSLDTTSYGTGSVTSVAALTLGTTGTDLSSTVATGTTTPVITLNVPTASATNRGALSSDDWSKFNTAYTNRITSLTTTGSSGSATLTTNTLNVPTYTLLGLGGQASSSSLTSLAGLTYVSDSFVKMTAAGTFSLDTNSYVTTSGNAATATTATNLAGGNIGEIPYQSGSSSTSFLAAGISGQVLTSGGSAAPTWTTVSSGSGTVTSVDMSVPTGLLVSGNPVTTTGTLAVTFDTGYSIPTTASQTNWDTAYTNRITSLTTTGSGAATLTSNVLNIPTPSAATFTSLTVTGSSGASTLSSGVLNVPTYTLAGLGGIKLADLSSTATGLTYTNTTGVFSATSGYAIPTTASQTNWDSAYTQRLQWDGGSTNLVAATGRTSLGLVIGTNVQAWDADLDAIAAIAGTTGLLKKTAANTWSLDTSTYLTANQTITLSGDITGSGTTAITTTLATVPITKGGTGQTTANAAVNALLPSQTSNSGKYLTTDGTNSSWGTVSSGTSIPSASMQMFAGAITQTVSAGVVTTTAPTGWLLCNGNAVSRSTYSALWTALGTTSSPYGQGDGSTTFNLPDLRSRVGVGVGQGSGLTNRTLGGTVGTETETLTSSQIPAHTHPNTVSGGNTGTMNSNASHTHAATKPIYIYDPGVSSGGLTASTYVRGSDTAGINPVTATNIDHTHTFTPSITNANNTGGGGSHNNMQPSIGLNYIIKT